MQYGVSPAPAKQSAPAGFLSAIPRSVLLAGFLAALLHMAPFWRAQSLAAPGWTFTGNLHESPDFIQYRSWMRVSQSRGVLVEDKFTGEPNRPNLPVLFYYALGKIAAVGHWQPEYVMAYAGAVLSFALVVLLFATIRLFFERPYQVWWTFLVLLIGGGLGAHLKFLGRFEAVRQNYAARRLIIEPLWNPDTLVFEDYRGHYLFTTLFDTHYLLAWLVTIGAVLSLYFALRRPSMARIAAMCGLYALSTVLHVYEGVTLAAITAAVAVLCAVKRLPEARLWPVFVAASLSASTSLMVLLWIQRSSGIPMPEWRELNILAAILFLAYPLAWIGIAWGLGAFWKNATLEGCFLLGWALACTAITLSGPFYPYPDRGVMTLQIPIYLIAALAYFARYPRVTAPLTVAIVFLCAATPAWMVLKWWNYIQFSPDALHMYTGPEQRDIIAALSKRASAGDVLLAPERDALWIAPEYPGRHYCAHFFLTVDYERKKRILAQFYGTEMPRPADFLRKEAIRFVYVPAGANPGRFAHMPGMSVLAAGRSGSLLEYHP